MESEVLRGYQIIGYGVGHFYNDLCASMWFTYLLLFLEKVVNMKSSVAGLIMLIGQVSTLFICAALLLKSQFTAALSFTLICVSSVHV